MFVWKGRVWCWYGGVSDVQMLVGARWPAAVKALSIAMLMEVIFAPSIRSKAIRWHAASTMAMSVGRGRCVSVAFAGSRRECCGLLVGIMFIGRMRD